jgi:ligand-binding sensor domain-containing protein/signal transduction histidine kinase/DNA-binding response OmpR family regulator
MKCTDSLLVSFELTNFAVWMNLNCLPMKTKLAFLLFFCPIVLFAENFTIEKIGMEQGLSNSYIVGITQDKQGYMWFATESGLNRFDGHSFRVYRKNKLKQQSINSNELNQVYADSSDNIIWIATQRTGLNAFNTKTEKFTYYTFNSSNPNSIVTNDITNIQPATDNKLWICTYHFGVDLMDKKTETFKHFNQSTVPGMVSNHVWCVADDMHGKLYIGHVFNGLSVLTIADDKIRNYTPNPSNPNALPGEEVTAIHIDKRNNIWVGTNNGLALFDPISEKFTVIRNIPGNPNTLSSNRIWCIKELGNDKLWIGTNQGGINILDLRQIQFQNPKNIVFQHIEANDDKSGLSNLSVKCLFQDSFNNLWIGTLGGGINIISNRKPFFKTWKYSPFRGAKNSLSTKLTWGICTDSENRVWIGTDGGLDVYDKGMKVNHFSKETGDLPDNFIMAALKDSEGNLWLGSSERDVIRYTPKNKRFQVMNSIKSVASIRCFYEDSKKRIWIGTNNGLFTYDLKTDKFKSITSETSNLPDNVILSVLEDQKGNLWIGTFGQGIAILNPDLKLIRNINTYNGFCSNAIYHLFKDSKNKIWVATREGLAVFKSAQDMNYRVFNEKDGIADSYTCALAEGNAGDIWASTNSGISHLYVQTGTFENFNFLDGIPIGNFMPGAVTTTSDGLICFASQNGVCYFNSKESPANYKAPKAQVTEFKYYDRHITQPENAFYLPVAGKIVLKHFQNTFSLSFNVLDFGLNDETEYAYMLKGLEDNWYNLGNEKQVTFRNIPHGNYEFKLKSRLRNQEWSNEVTTLQITIKPPFWLTWWAKTLYFLLIIWLIQYIAKFYKRRLDLENDLYLEQKNHQQEQELNDERMSFYTNITHELRTPLTLIIGPLKDLETDKTLSSGHLKKISLISRSATRLLNLINQIMEFRKTETQNRKLSVIKGNIASLIQEIGIKYESLNQNPDVRFRFNIESNSHKLFYDPEIITIILDNLISNALKYTKRGEISLSLKSLSENHIKFTEIEVKDSGCGIPQEALNRIFDRYYQVNNENQVAGSGIGLSLVKNLAELHHGSISVESTMGVGSIFRFRFRTENQYPDAQHTEIRTKPAETDEISLTKGLVLIVEDNDEIREYIARSLSDLFNILEATNGKKGMELAFEHIPDIIVSDVMMPVMDGMEFCKIMKEDIRTSHIPLILLTAKDTLQDRMDGYSIGADSYITKPFSAGLLQTRVKNLLETKQKLAMLYSSSLNQKQVFMTESLNKLDKEFMDKVNRIIEDNLDSEQINVAFIAEQMHMSHSTLYRKIKALTSMSANEIIKKLKLQKAEQLLLSGKYSVSEISYMIGFSTPTYFRQCFKEEFGQSPTEYLKQIKGEK